MITFDDDISLLLITGKNIQVLCDTHLGSLSIEAIRPLFNREYELIVFNSHSDWDHIWGNGEFNCHIIAHDLCPAMISERWEKDLLENSDKIRGNVRQKLPDMAFKSSFSLVDERIVFRYAPGHTIDSAVCYDIIDKVLYMGDLVEDPIPFLDKDLPGYITTLKAILDSNAEILVSAHSGIVDRGLVLSNIDYIARIMQGLPIDDSDFLEYKEVHRQNCLIKR